MNRFGEYLKTKSLDSKNINQSIPRKHSKSRPVISYRNPNISPKDSPPPDSSGFNDSQNPIIQRSQSPEEIVEPQVKRIALMMKRFRESPPRSRKERSSSKFSNSSDLEYSNNNITQTERSFENRKLKILSNRRIKKRSKEKKSPLWKETVDFGEEDDDDENIDNNSIYISQLSESGGDGYYDGIIDSNDGMFFMDEELEAEQNLLNEEEKTYSKKKINIENEDENSVGTVQERLRKLFKKRGIEDTDLSYPTYNQKKEQGFPVNTEKKYDDDDDNNNIEEEEEDDDDDIEELSESINNITQEFLRNNNIREKENNNEQDSSHIPRYHPVPESSDEEHPSSNDIFIRNLKHQIDNHHHPTITTTTAEKTKKNKDKNNFFLQDIKPLYHDDDDNNKNKKRNKEEEEEIIPRRRRRTKEEVSRTIDIFIQNSIETVLLEQEIKNLFKFKIENPKFSELKNNNTSYGNL